ncbi:hypothetical protein C5167_012709 [Papaver somniferum]|uniref:Uncharacterized protein n=1 Tax=Papaver somniferum TaxID=3469 RepID=A0A4Y7J268_PAPSO|nr:hypothetical protein C5167_012709 [Papaver somniferum]
MEERNGRKWMVPEPLIMSHTDGPSKMSKSDPSDQSRINLLDSKDVTCDKNKIKRCKTDSLPEVVTTLVAGFLSFSLEGLAYTLLQNLNRLEFGNPDRPECNNLVSVYQPVAGKTKEARYSMLFSLFSEVARECHDMDWGEFKPFLTDALVNHLHPTQVLVDGATKAVDIADATLNDVYQAMLLWDSCEDEKNQYCCKNQYESNLEFTCGRSH